MALPMLRSSKFHGSPSSGFHGSPYAKELRVPWLSLCQGAKGSMSLLMLGSVANQSPINALADGAEGLHFSAFLVN